MKDQAVEAWLNELEISFEYVDELDRGKVDERASLRNQARLLAVDDEVVERYVEFMRLGDVFPPVLVRQRLSGALVVLGGNHRYKAAGAAPREGDPIDRGQCTVIRHSLHSMARSGRVVHADGTWKLGER